MKTLVVVGTLAVLGAMTAVSRQLASRKDAAGMPALNRLTVRETGTRMPSASPSIVAHVPPRPHR